MSTNYATRPAAEIEQDVRRTRSEMDQTIDRLGEQLNPRHLLDNVLEFFRGNESSSTGQNVAESLKSSAKSVKRSVKENPIPAMLCAAGALWWLFEERSEEDECFDLESRDRGFATDEEDGYPAWHPQYNWERSRAESREQWNERADNTLSDLQRAFEDDSSPGEAMRGTASKILSLSGYKRQQIHDGIRHSRSPDVRSSWESLSHLDSVASNHESSQDDTWAETAKKYWQSVKQTLSDTTSSTQDKFNSISSAIADYAKETGSTVGNWSGNSAATASQWAGAAKRRTGKAMSYGRGQVGVAGERMGAGIKVAKDRVVVATDEYPLAAAGACFGLGLAAGLLLPSTDYEDRMVGETSDDVSKTVKDTADELLERGKHVAAQSASAALDEAESQGLTPERIGEKVRETTTAAKERVKDAATQTSQKAKETKEAAKSVGSRASKKATTEARRHAK